MGVGCATERSTIQALEPMICAAPMRQRVEGRRIPTPPAKTPIASGHRWPSPSLGNTRRLRCGSKPGRTRDRVQHAGMQRRPVAVVEVNWILAAVVAIGNQPEALASQRMMWMDDLKGSINTVANAVVDSRDQRQRGFRRKVHPPELPVRTTRP
jgi:hypothetical protein